MALVKGRCPTGFELYRDGQCRGKYTSVQTWWDEEANLVIEKCTEIQGTPVVIHSEEDNQYWVNKIDPLFRNELVIDLSGDCYTDCGYTLTSYGCWDGGCGHVEYPVDVYCTTQLHQPVPNADGCESFEDDSDDGVCYQVGATATNWAEAQKICKTFGANLASIHNSMENSFIRRLAVSKGAVSGVFLGATVTGKGNEYGWIDGSPWDYEHFYPGFPINGIGECVAMDTSSPSGQWQNFDCSTELPVACIRDPRTYNMSMPTCTGTGKEGEIITSPGFPFDASTPCDYFLSVKSGKKVELEVIFLEANTCCDFLTLYDGNVGGNMIAKITGEVRNVTYKSSATNIMKVSWQPNGGVNVQGLMMSV